MTTDVEVFLYNEGYLEWNKEEAKLVSSLVNDPTTLKKWTKEQAINTIYADKIPNALEEVVLYWNTSIKLNDYLVNEAMEAYFQMIQIKNSQIFRVFNLLIEQVV